VKTYDAVKLQGAEFWQGVTIGMALMALWTLWLM